MRYKNVKVKTPEVENITPAEKDFMMIWDTMAKNRRAIENLLSPGLKAIKRYHYLHGDHSLLLDNFELHEAAGGLKSICYCLEVHTNGNMHQTNFLIPLTAVLGGEADVIAFFAAEKEKQELKARELGAARQQRDKDARKKVFDELKLEFDPPTEAIIKHEGVTS